jgi:hypothetical protein
MAKKRILRFLRNTLISIGVLLVLTIGGGVAYTWYVGEYSEVPPAAIAAPVEAAPRQLLTAPKISPDAPVSASIQMLTSPVTPGSNASIMIKTNLDLNVQLPLYTTKYPAKIRD